MIRPGTLRERELVEVHMQWSVWDGWVPDYLRVRNIDIDRVDPLLLAAPARRPKDEQPAEEVAPVDEPADDEEAGDAVEDAAEDVEDAAE